MSRKDSSRKRCSTHSVWIGQLALTSHANDEESIKAEFFVMRQSRKPYTMPAFSVYMKAEHKTSCDYQRNGRDKNTREKDACMDSNEKRGVCIVQNEA